MLETGGWGTFYNVTTNLADLQDKEFKTQVWINHHSVIIFSSPVSELMGGHNKVSFFRFLSSLSQKFLILGYVRIFKRSLIINILPNAFWPTL